MTLSRREFIKDSTLFAAAAATFGASAAGGPGEEPKPAKKVDAHSRLRVAVVGFNGQGGAHIDQFAKLPDTIVTHLCDVDRSLADKGIQRAEAIQKHRPEFVHDIRKLLEIKEIDIVTIATPNHWHALAAIWAIQHGKHVYLEKPVSHNVWEGRRIVDAARHYQKIVQTGTQSRSNEGMRKTIEYLRSGKLGKCKLARGLCYKTSNRQAIKKGAGRVPDPVDFDLWCGPAPDHPPIREKFHYDWHWFWDYGNGDLGNQGIHEVDKARWGLGKSGLCKKVLSVGGRFLWDDCAETPNSMICWFDYGDAQLVFETRNLKSQPFRGASIGNIWYCEDGYVVSTNYSSGAAYTLKGELIEKFEGEGNHVANFIRAVKSGKPADLNADIEEGHVSSALCHLGNISYRLGSVEKLDPNSDRLPLENRLELDKDGVETYQRMLEYLQENKVELNGLPMTAGQPLAFDPKTERFVGHDKANAMLMREYRKGFEVPKAF